MIGALRSLQRASGQAQLPQAIQAFGIGGGGAAGFARWFRSHPPIEERIAALQKLA